MTIPTLDDAFDTPQPQDTDFSDDFFAGSLVNAAQSIRAKAAQQAKVDVEPKTERHKFDAKTASYMNALRRTLEQMSAPGFVTDFIADHWSIVLLQSRNRAGARMSTEELAKIGVLLVMSTQPKTTIAQRDAAERSMPGLVNALEQGMVSIQLTDDDRAMFFRQLMPAQAEALRGGTVSAMSIVGGDARTVQIALERILNPMTYLPSDTATA